MGRVIVGRVIVGRVIVGRVNGYPCHGPLGVGQKSQCVQKPRHKSRNEARCVFRAHASWHGNFRGIEAWILKRRALLNTHQVPQCV